MTKYFVKNTETGEVIGDVYYNKEKTAEKFRAQLIDTVVTLGIPIECITTMSRCKIPPSIIHINMNYTKSNTAVCKKEK